MHLKNNPNFPMEKVRLFTTKGIILLLYSTFFQVEGGLFLKKNSKNGMESQENV